MAVVDSESVVRRVENGALRCTRGRLVRKKVSLQIINIRRSCKLSSTGWSVQAEACLQQWLLKTRKTDRRVVRALPSAGIRRSIRKAKAGDKLTFAARVKDLDKYLREGGCRAFEGHIGQDRGKGEVLSRLASGRHVACVAQTGLNCGHSAALFLDASKANVVSFESRHAEGSTLEKNVKRACTYLSTRFPGRHTVILGNSQTTLPAFIAAHKPLRRYFDFCLVDGGHSFVCAASDIKHFHMCARPGAVIVVDDVRTNPKHPWEKGPTRAWQQAIATGLVKQTGCSETMVWGNFLV